MRLFILLAVLFVAACDAAPTAPVPTAVLAPSIVTDSLPTPE